MNARHPLVLLSGGADSTAVLAHTLADPNRIVDTTAMFIDYGQRHIIERESARAVAAHYGVPLVDLDLRAFGASVKSALTGDGDIPHGHYAADNMAQTVVPNRNATMLMAAVGIAVYRGATEVVAAVHAGDRAVYRDCRPEFIDAISAASELSCGVKISAPFMHMTKAQIISRGAELGVPYHLTWSCYEGNHEGHCGRCGTCVERAESFHGAGIPDPTTYLDHTYWKQVTK